MKRKVFLLQPIHDAGVALLRERDDVDVVTASAISEEVLMREVCDAHAIIARATPVSRTMIDAARDLIVVARHGVGYDQVDVAALTERRIPLTIAIHANALSVAEHTLYFIHNRM